MNPFRRWFGKRPSAEPPPTLAVPPDHQLKARAVPTQPEPELYPLPGGVCVISLGHGSDEPLEDLEELVSRLEPLMAGPQPPVLLSEEGSLSRLFAPANPAHHDLPRFLLWVFTQAALEDWLAEPARLQALLRHLYRFQHVRLISQCAYFERDSGPGAAVMAWLVAGLRIPAFEADPAPDRLLLAEVHRPDGKVFTAMAGRIFPLEGAADTTLRTLNELKDEAENQGDVPRLRQLEQSERDHLERVLHPLQSKRRRTPPLRAPRLCRLLRTAVEQRGPTARWELERELLERVRQLPLLLKRNGQPFIANLPGIGPVLQAFPDMRSLQLAAKELGLAEGSYVPGTLPVRDFFGLGAQQNLLVALNLSLTAYTSQDVRWSPAEARLLALGQYATAAPGNTLTPEQLRGLLTEADGYLNQGLYDKAFEPLRRIFSCLPENLDAHEKAFHVYAAAGNTTQALEQCLNVLRLCTRRQEVRRAQPYLSFLLERAPAHPELPAFLAVLGPDELPLPLGEKKKAVTRRSSRSLELTAEEQRDAHIFDTAIQVARLFNGNRPSPGLPPGATPLTALEAGASDSKLFRIKRALQAGLDPNEKTATYGTALHAAAQAGQLDAARLLVEHGADPTLRDNQGRTPGELARLRQHWDVAAFLESAEGSS